MQQPPGQPDPGSLDRLHDIVVPPAVPWWPPAAGWYGVAALLLIGAGIAAFLMWRRWRANAYRRAGLVELDRLERAGPDALEALPALVKRVALARFPREQVAALSGDAWLEFLDRTRGTATFTRAPAHHLASLAYDAKVAQSLDSGQRARILAAARDWIRGHRAPKRTG